MAITLAELKQQSRERADMVNNNFITDSELNSYINSSIAELHDIIVQSFEHDYYVKDVSFNTVSGQDEYDLDTVVTDQDFYKLRGLDAKLNNDQFFTLQPFNFNERNRYQNFGTWDYLGIANVRYRIVGNKIKLTPTPDSALEVKIWYIPTATKLTTDTDELDDLNQFAEYVIVDAAIKMLQKEESDVTVLLAQKAALKRRIEEAANNRDAGAAESVEDIYVKNQDFFFGRSGD